MPQGQFEDFLDLNIDYFFSCKLHHLCLKIKSCITGSTTDAFAALYHKTLHIEAVPEHANAEKEHAVVSSCHCHMCA